MELKTKKGQTDSINRYLKKIETYRNQMSPQNLIYLHILRDKYLPKLLS